GIALGAALVGGGFLLKAWHAAPFVLAAFVTTAACGAAILLVREDGGHGRVFEGVGAYFKRSWCILREEPEVRRFLIANALLGAVAAGYVIAAVFAGRLGDRFGIARVIFLASFVYGGGFFVAGFAN